MITKYFQYITAILIAAVAISADADAAYFVKNGKLINARDAATKPVHEHYNAGMEAYQRGNWIEARNQFRIVNSSFPGSSFGQDAAFYLGVSLYKMGEFEFANNSFEQYLKGQNNPKYFEEAITFKYHIAEKFRQGAKRHLLGRQQMPRWAPGQKQALMIFDEVVAAMPSHDVAARAFFSKAKLLRSMKEYREAVDNLQQVTRRFPTHELAPDAYLEIASIYLERTKREHQNPDLLALADINLRKFRLQFPGDDRADDVAAQLYKIRESYACALYETGRFYERVKQPRASVVYYSNAIKRFGDTDVADSCRERLACLGEYIDELGITEDVL